MPGSVNAPVLARQLQGSGRIGFLKNIFFKTNTYIENPASHPLTFDIFRIVTEAARGAVFSPSFKQTRVGVSP